MAIGCLLGLASCSVFGSATNIEPAVRGAQRSCDQSGDVAGKRSQANEKSLKPALAEHRSDIALAATGFAGPGAEILQAAVADARYVFMGEDHGMAEVARAATALYQTLQPLGWDTLAVEVGPHAAAELASILESQAPDARMRTHLDRYPMGVAFYNWREEFAFLRQAAALAGSKFRLIGLDQEFVGAAKLLLQKALESSTGELRARIAALLAEEATSYQRARSSGNPQDLFMMQVNTDRLRQLRDDLRRVGSAGAAALDALLESRAIYDGQTTGAYSSNVRRARTMKRLLATALGARTDKVMLKLGGYHGFKGWAPLKHRELGAFVAELAEASGSHSVHILVLGVRGTKLSFTGVDRAAAATTFDLRDKDHGLGIVPLADVAAAHRSWSLFDLRPLRPQLRQLELLAPATEHLILGYDLVLLVPEVTASTEIAEVFT